VVAKPRSEAAQLLVKSGGVVEDAQQRLQLGMGVLGVLLDADGGQTLPAERYHDTRPRNGWRHARRHGVVEQLVQRLCHGHAHHVHGRIGQGVQSSLLVSWHCNASAGARVAIHHGS
jgi:hypothetical protein